ncbi:MAG: outer membrane lipoprotein carrier protein LolA [Balneolaceae bacterium]
MKYLKSWAFKSVFIVLLSLFLIPVQAFTAQSDTPNFDALKSEFENNNVFVSDFSHQYEDAFTGETESAEGKIWIAKERYKVEGSSQLMVVDEDISRVYDGNKNRVIISDYVEEEDDFAPSRMLQGVDDSYSVEESVGENGAATVTLSSDDPFSIFKTVTIQLNESGDPVEIRAIDQADNSITTRFDNGGFTQPSADLFEMDVPEGAERVDLRHGS